jgi:hypothetical protein
MKKDAYINTSLGTLSDLKPEYPDRITKLSFIDIEKSLKHDLQNGM